MSCSDQKYFLLVVFGTYLFFCIETNMAKLLMLLARSTVQCCSFHHLTRTKVFVFSCVGNGKTGTYMSGISFVQNPFHDLI